MVWVAAPQVIRESVRLHHGQAMAPEYLFFALLWLPLAFGHCRKISIAIPLLGGPSVATAALSPVVVQQRPRHLGIGVARGRVATRKAYEHLGIAEPHKSSQGNLFS